MCEGFVPTGSSTSVPPAGMTFSGTTPSVVTPADAGEPSTSTTSSSATNRVLSAVHANNVVTDGQFMFLALGEEGLGILDPATGELTTIAIEGGSADDLSVADGFLFVLDADGAGALRVYDVQTNPLQPELVSGPVAVPAGPFTGVSAANGRVVVSGGTNLLVVHRYDPTTGVLDATPAGSIDLGIGQPDVLLTEDGRQAIVSTDFSGAVDGAEFGITVVDLEEDTAVPTIEDRVGLPDAGFTAGGFEDVANFPIESALLPDNQTVVANGDGLSLVDLRTGTLIGTLDLGFATRNVDTIGTTAFVVGGDQLVEIDFSDATNPQLVSQQTIGSDLTGVAASDEFLVLADNDGGTILLPRSPAA